MMQELLSRTVPSLKYRSKYLLGKSEEISFTINKSQGGQRLDISVGQTFQYLI